MSLNPGDIAIIGVNADDPDAFSFVALVDIAAGEEITFTNSGWQSDDTFRGNEGAVKWTAPTGGIMAGTVIDFTGVGGDFTAANDANVGTGGFSLSTSGDQVIAFTGPSSNPTFLFAVQTNSTAFQTNSDDSNQSDLPDGLVVGTTAVAVGAAAGAESEFDNSVYNGSVTSGTREELLAAIADASNWNGNNERINDLSPNTYSVTPAGAFDLQVTEIWPGQEGSDVTDDWFEITNEGDAAWVSGVDPDLFYDDDSADITAADLIEGLTDIQPGESVIIVIGDASAAATFTDVWGAVVDLTNVEVGFTDGSGLGQGGDAVNLFLGPQPLAPTPIETEAYPDAESNSGQSYDVGLAAFSTEGNANGAVATTVLGGVDNVEPAIASPGNAPALVADQALLLTEIVVTPTGGEFIEIYNPNQTAVDLSDIYLTDATFAGGGTFYYNLPTGSNAGGGGFGDFLARFPDGASIDPGTYVTVALAGSEDFFAEYNQLPTYELFDDGDAAEGVEAMREAFAGSINNQGGLTNGGEVVVLTEWDGTSDLVQDHDYVVWGDKAEAVDKTGVSIDGPDADADATAYQNDTPVASQEVVSEGAHAFGQSFQRQDLTEGNETQSGGNGVFGADEMSEDLSNTWTTGTPTPNAEFVVPLDLVVTIDEASINENGGTSTATVMRPGSTTGELVVTLVSSDTTEATVPPTVTIQDGQSSAQFTVTAVDDSDQDALRTVTVTASASGFLDGADTIDIIGDDLSADAVKADELTETNRASVLVDGAEDLVYDPQSQKIFVATGNGLAVVDASDPFGAGLQLLGTIDVTTLSPNMLGGSPTGNDITSVSLSPIANILAIAVPDADPTANGVVVLFDTTTEDGTGAGVLAGFEVGVGPDDVTFTPDGQTILTANEGERDGNDDPQSSITFIVGTTTPQVITVDFTSFNLDQPALQAQGIRIDDGRLLSNDVEPESIVVSSDGSTAFVTLQENNAIAVVDIATQTITELRPLGTVDHSLPGNEIDPSDRDEGINLQSVPVEGLRMPDVLTTFTIDGVTYYATANEGDDRGEDERIGNLTLDPTAFPNAAALQADDVLGRLGVSTIDGDLEGDGDFDALFSYGTRSFSIFNADTGALVFDSGSLLAQIVALEDPAEFNANEDVNAFDERSDNKGPEPEGMTFGEIDGVPYLFIGLERASGDILAFDISNPASPVYVQSFKGDAVGSVPPSPEGMQLISASDSPTGNPLLIAANTASGNTGIQVFEIGSEFVASEIAFNEIRVSSSGSSDDTSNYVELIGTPGESLDGLTLLSISSEFEPGEVSFAFDLTGGVFDDNGIFLLSNPGEYPEDAGDVQAEFDLFGSPQTFILVDGFAGSQGDDLDTNNDGTFDAMPWRGIVADLALLESDIDTPYSDLQIVGSSSSFPPAYVFAAPDGSDTFVEGSFSNLSEDTPGELNVVLTINEVDADTPSTDVAEFIELFDGGIGNVPLDGLAILLINGNGDVTYDAIDLDGQTTDENGFFVLGNPFVPNVDLLLGGEDNNIQNGADAVALVRGDASDFPNGSTVPTEGVVDAVVYGTNDADDTDLLNALGETTQFEDTDVTSVSRAPDGTGEFTTGIPTPGAANHTPIVARLISEVQGTGDTSPLLGQTVIVTAIVTADFQDGDIAGFYLMEESADQDADASTSEGIFVAETATDVNVGDLVEVTATVAEVNGETRLVNASSVVVNSSGNTVPDAAVLVSGTNGFAGTFTNADGIQVVDLEAFEGMLVTVPEELTVTDLFTLGRYGEVGVTAGGRINTFTQENAPDIQGFADFTENAVARTLMIDDGSFSENGDPILFPDGELDGQDGFRAGDTLENLTGVVRFGYATGDTDDGGSDDLIYRINPTMTPVFEDTNPRPETPPEVGGSLEVASFNVLNFFNGDGLGGGFPTPRGADNANELDRQTQKIVAAIDAIDADIVGLMEIENDGYGANSAIQELVDALNAVAGAGTYDFVDPGQANGLLGTDAITVGFLYKPSEVALIGIPVVLDETIDGRFDTTVQRPSLIATFEEIESGADVTVSVNHFKSKGSVVFGENAIGDGQANNNPTRERAAEALVDFLATDPTGAGTDNVLIIGDLNAYAQEDPIQAILDGSDDTRGSNDDFVNVVGETDIYTFGFPISLDTAPQVQTFGALDHALGSKGIEGQVTGAEVWHINADEPATLDYNTDFITVNQQTTLFDPGPFRSSDHDPVLVGLELDGNVDLFSDGSFSQRIGRFADVDTAEANAGAGNAIVINRFDGLGQPNTVDVGTDNLLVSSDLTTVFSFNLNNENNDGNFRAVGSGGLTLEANSNESGRISLGEGDDFVTGRFNEDRIVGNDGDDSLYGNNGDDTVIGGEGADLLRGGKGRDKLVYLSETGITLDLKDSGNSTGEAAGDDIFAFEVFQLTNGDDTFIAKNDRVIVRGQDGNDSLVGSAENDVLEGGAGADTLEGGEGNDMADYRGDAVTIDLTDTTNSTGDAAGDVYDSIERFRLTKNGDTFFGTDGDERVLGEAGDDMIMTGHGNDTAEGGAGADTFGIETGDGQLRILDFVNGEDVIGLQGGLTVNDLTFSGGQILSGDDVLAILVGADTSTLTESDFALI